MKPNPTVSIILPTYNRAALLPRAIDSVLAQSFTDWELLIWDDGSTDNTSTVVQAYKDARIRYYSDVNHGAALCAQPGIGEVLGGPDRLPGLG